MAFPSIEAVETRTYEVPTEGAESDGTLSWTSTTIVVVEVRAADAVGLGYTYSHRAAARLIDDTLADLVLGESASSPERVWWKLLTEVRNVGRQGVCAHAISALDVALWDLKARLLAVRLHDLWGSVRSSVDVYGSGGFTSLSGGQLQEQIRAWSDGGIRRFKIKVGSRPKDDLERVRAAAAATPEDGQLFVDANGAYDRKQALAFAERAAELGVTWLEEPVTSDDLEGLRLVRDRAPAPLRVTAGEYGYHPIDQLQLLRAGAVDVLQIDATRCLGYTGFLKAASLCDAFSLPLSTHTAPALHLPLGLSVQRLLHLEYFHDHVRIERELFSGAPRLSEGRFGAQETSFGHGLRLRDVPEWRVEGSATRRGPIEPSG